MTNRPAVPLEPGQGKEILQIARMETKNQKALQVVSKSLELRAAGIKYYLGGKYPQEGFDTSGFVAYIFADAGLLDFKDLRTYSTLEIKRHCLPIDAAALEIGDLVFYKDGFIAIYVGGNQAIGMSSTQDILLLDMKKRFSVSEYRRWPKMI